MKAGNQELTAAAIEAIGTVPPSSFELQPRQHVQQLKDRAAAAPLVRILGDTQFEQLVDGYEAADRAARSAQLHYKRCAMFAAVASFLAILIASVMLLVRPGVLPPVLSTIALVAQFSFLVLSILASLWLGWRRPYEAWMQQRAEAETLRIRLFRRIVESEESANEGELPALPLQLEYFRRFQLDVQRNYYDKRGRQHRAAVTRGLLWRGVALVLIVSASLPVLWTLQGNEWFSAVIETWLDSLPPQDEWVQRLFLCLGLVGGALQGLLAAYALISYDERNAARYRDTLRNLEDLAARPLDEARNAAALGQRDRVLAFVALCHEQISSEHREWVSLRSVAPELSLDRLRALTLPKL